MSDVQAWFVGDSWPTLSDRGFPKRRRLGAIARPETSIFGLAVNEHGVLVKVRVQAIVLGPFCLPFRISPEATSQNGRALGEGAWTALGAEHVRAA